MTKFPRPATLLALGALLLGAACMKQESKTTVLKDGSGTIVYTMTNDLVAWGKLRAQLAPFIGGSSASGSDPAADAEPLVDVDDFTHLKVEGIKWTKPPEQTVKDGKQTIRLEAAFSDWSLLGKANLVFGSASLAKNEDGTWTWTLASPFDFASFLSGSSSPEGASGLSPEMLQMIQAAIPLFQEYLGGLEVAQTLTLPGTIVETNGTKSEDGTTVSWKIGFKDVVAGKTTMKVTFKGEGLELKPFQTKPDPRRLIDKLTKPRPKAPPTVTPSTPGEPKPGEPKPGEPPPAPAMGSGERPSDPPPTPTKPGDSPTDPR
jgi:hypothetical protein